MRKYGSNRPSATLYVARRRRRNNKPSFFLRFFIFLFLLIGIGVGGFMGARYAWRVFQEAQITDWHVKSVAVNGVSGAIEKEMFTKASLWQGKPFSVSQAENLRREFTKAYPQFRQVAVSRGLLSGTLKVTAKRREPVARFVLPDQTQQFIDEDSTIYTDPHGPQDILQVNLVGPVPAKLQPGFVELVQGVLKLKKSLPFSALVFDLQHNTVTMQLPDQSQIHFGTALHLKKKVARAAQIMDLARQKYQQPVILNFEFFEQGKVFLTLSAH